jgi:hypothetical protein
MFSGSGIRVEEVAMSVLCNLVLSDISMIGANFFHRVGCRVKVIGQSPVHVPKRGVKDDDALLVVILITVGDRLGFRQPVVYAGMVLQRVYAAASLYTG